MKYRKFGQLDWQASALGFGAMRFPTNTDNKIDEAQAIEMIRYAIDHGVNYIDTAWPYHSGQSEIIVAKALEDGYRDKVKLATKLPSWLIESQADMNDYLDKQLEKLQTDCIDFYLLHALNKKYWDNYKKLEIFKWLEKIKIKGKIKHVGFSFHADYQLFKEIVDNYDWDFCQIQYNYLDTNFQAGYQGLRYAADKGLAVVIMEPLRGGNLANTQPQTVKEIFDHFNSERSYVDWALQWLWHQPEVSLVLSGMSNLQQVTENIESAANSGIYSLTADELKTIAQIQDAYDKLSPVGCTGCEYCLPCPRGVNIPRNFKLYSRAKTYDHFDENAEKYHNLKEAEQTAACIECGACEKLCPQDLKIINLLKEVDSYFSKKN